MSDSPIEEMLESLRAALAARRRDGAARVERVEAALAGYRRAVEQQIASEFAAEHRLKAPQPVGFSVARAAEELRDAVLALPEVSRLSLESAAIESAPMTLKAPKSVAVGLPPPSLGGFPKLRAAFATQKLVIVGALSRDRSESVPEGFAEHTEWIDTERDGVHALGNLPQRIRQGRVCALVILDRAVKHKHSEPALAAARDAQVPTAFAGQGGRASLERALTQLEGMLSERA
jgi:hypothetical protein